MGWLEHLGGLDMRQVKEVSRLPSKREPDLLLVNQAVQVALDRCLQMLAQTDRETCQWWRSAKSDETSLRPLEAMRTKSALTRYIGYWQQFMIYCLRINGLSDDLRS